jgi:hypothetical protein
VLSLQPKKYTIFYSLLSLNLLLWIQSCKETPYTPPSQPQINVAPIPSEEVSEQKPLISNNSVRKEFSEWNSYHTLDTAIKNLENGDSSFFKTPIEDINQLFLGIKKSIPTSLKTNGILARVKVTETLTRKLHELYNVEKTDLKESDQTKIDLIESHNNLIFQINKTREKDAQQILKPI